MEYTLRRMVPQTAERLSLAAAALVVLVIGLVTYKSLVDRDRRSDQVEITRQVMDGTNALFSTLKDAETARQGFLLTGEESYLAPYHQAVRNLPALLDGLTAAASIRNPDQAARVERMRPLIREKLAELAETIELMRSRHSAEALSVVRTNRGQAVMDQIRAISAEIQSVANARLKQYADRAAASWNLLGLVSTLGSGAIFVLLAIATAAIQRGTRRREQLIASLAQEEARAKRSSEWLQTTLNSIGDGVIATDASGNVALLNAVAESLTGWKQGEAAGKPLDQVFAICNGQTGLPLENPAARALREGRIAGLANHTRLVARDGRQIPIDESAAPIFAGGGVPGVVLVFRDISERLKAEERMALTVEAAPNAMILVGRDGRMELMNSQAEKLFGYKREDLLGKSIDMLVPERTRAAHGELRAAFTREPLARPMGAGRDLFGVRKDGVEVPIEIGLNPIRTSQGDFVLTAIIDISERKRAEENLRAANAELMRANEDLRLFAFAASHDLQEPLRMITSYSQLLVKGYRDRPEADAKIWVEFITEGTRRMQALLADLLAYTQLGAETQEIAPVDLNGVFRAAVENCKAAVAESGAEVSCDPLPTVPGHEPHFLQLLQNLIGNSLKYRGGRPPRIQVFAQEEKGGWLIGVKDNGIGIAPEYHRQIFAAFKRLHGRNIPGTGIGLAICQRVVNRYGGRIWVDSQEGQGATFYFTLPAAVKGTAARAGYGPTRS